MSVPWLTPVASALGPTSFGLVAWGAIVLVCIVFGYIVWALLRDRTAASVR